MVLIRPIIASDAEAVALLHAESWRSTYAGILSETYLAGPIFEERLAIWRARYLDPNARQVGLLAWLGDEPVGFVYAVGGAHAEHGTLLDNLHVAPAGRGNGVGTRLLAHLAKELHVRGESDGVYLWAYEDNHRTRQYYLRLGAEERERALEDAPDGGSVAEWLYTWPSLKVFASHLGVSIEG